MVPYAIFAGTLLLEKERIELSALDLTPDGFTARLPKRKASALFGIEKRTDSAMPEGLNVSLRLRFYAYRENRYHELHLANVPAPKLEDKAFWTELTFTIDNPDFSRETIRLLTEYNHYIQLKLTGDDEYMSREMTGYPVDELNIPESFQEQKRVWFTEGLQKEEVNVDAALEKSRGYGICLDTPGRCREYLSQSFDVFFELYKKDGFGSEDLAEQYLQKMGHVHADDFRYLYIGSQLCPNRIPALSVLERLLRKALAEDRTPVICLSYMPQSRVEEVRDLLAFLEEFAADHETFLEGGKLEVVYNDYGMEDMLREKVYVQGERGILLRKHRKDPRARWKNGASNTAIERVSNRDELDQAVFYPYYQTNTATYCTLYAACENGSRGRQQEVKKCTFACEHARFLYASDLHLTGYGNSLLGINTDLPQKGKRIILNLV